MRNVTLLNNYITGGVSVGNSLPGHTTLNLDYLRPADDEYSSGWTANDLVERHQDGF